MNCEEVGWQGLDWTDRTQSQGHVDWTDQSQDRDKWRTVLNAVINIGVP